MDLAVSKWQGAGMIHYSVVIPHRNAAEELGSQLPLLCQTLGRLVLPFEIICIDDASDRPQAAQLRTLLARTTSLRVLRFDQPRGTSAALTAGIAAARGDLILALAPRFVSGPLLIPQLISRLSHFEFVFARQPLTLASRLRHGADALVRHLQASLDPAADEPLLWAARREAVAGLTLAREAFRLLPDMVASNGFRVCRLCWSPGSPPRGQAYRTSWWTRLLTRRLQQSFEPHLARQWPAGPTSPPAGGVVRVDVGRNRLAPEILTTRADEDRPHAV